MRIQCRLNEQSIIQKKEMGRSWLRAGLRRGMEAVCEMLREEAVRRCPRETGRLAESFGTRVTAEGDGVRGVVGTGVEYAVYVHEGIGAASPGGGGANPFLRQSLEERAGDAAEILARAVAQG
ncbi:MAG: HK97 gp10 family phage protein [Christensenellales bacterium]|nr:HK97 gp10 family phage protein [Christensenellales bacterium]